MNRYVIVPEWMPWSEVSVRAARAECEPEKPTRTVKLTVGPHSVLLSSAEAEELIANLRFAVADSLGLSSPPYPDVQ